MVNQKNTYLFIVHKEPEKNYLVQICDIDCQSNMEWPIYDNFFISVFFPVHWKCIWNQFFTWTGELINVIHINFEFFLEYCQRSIFTHYNRLKKCTWKKIRCISNTNCWYITYTFFCCPNKSFVLPTKDSVGTYKNL